MNAPATNDTQTDLTVPPALWRVAAAFMHILQTLFGMPRDLATQCFLSLKAHRLTSSWLSCGEAMMRRLLLIEAQSFIKPIVGTPRCITRKRTRKPLPPVSPEMPEKWRVSFPYFVSHRHHSPRQRPDTLQQLEKIRRELDYDDWIKRRPERQTSQVLAERYEALLRAFNNPLAYARRLARRLYAAPKRAFDLLREPPEARHRIDHYAELSDAAETSAALFNTS